MKRIWIIGLALLGFMSISAQEDTLLLSLQQAHEYALENNKNLQNATKDVLIAREQYKEALGQGLPQINGSVDYSTNFQHKLSLMGAPIELEDQSNANIQVTQLIFSGQYFMGLKLAKLGKEISKKTNMLTELETKEQVTNLYYTILVSHQFLNNLNQSISENEDVLHHTNNMFKAGLLEQTDVDQIRVTLSQLKNSKNSTERSLKYAYNLFQFTLGLEKGKSVKLVDDIDSFLNYFANNTISESQFDINNNINYQLVLSKEELDKKSVNFKKWAYAPTVSAFYSYTEKLLVSGLDFAPNHVAGATLSVPIFSGGTKRAQVSQAKIELEKTLNSKQMLEDNLYMQYNQLTYNYSNAYENYLTQKENVEVAKRVNESYLNKFRHGMISSLDLTQVNMNYLSASNSYVNASLELLQAKLQLDKLFNTL
ncbi:MAG: TolC family protein [Marinilabiliaceae bacterium]|nr:TolC family protein [Marinilabiliaceae bacterium]